MVGAQHSIAKFTNGCPVKKLVYHSMIQDGCKVR
jgi:hypothetical protein